jgi:seryl-tRNA(Sec) selenium transferase
MASHTTSGVYERLGVQPIINAAGSETAAGGTLMPQAVLDAMAEAAGQYVLIEELNAAVGRKIAEATGAEAGYVTSVCVKSTSRAVTRLPVGWSKKPGIGTARLTRPDVELGNGSSL